MNFAVSCGAASVFAAGAAGAAGGFGDISACARAPETISALIAAEIISVLSIVASDRVCSVKERSLPCPGTTREHSHAFRALGTWQALLRRGLRIANPLDGAALETEHDGRQTADVPDGTLIAGKGAPGVNH
jgi:hypothetical protein